MAEVKSRFRGGWVHFTLARVATRIHWSALPGAIFFSAFAWAPGYWLGFIVLILIHELGHAAVAKACRLSVRGIDVYAGGGVCYTSGRRTALEGSLVSWGGVWAQLLAFGIAFTLSKVLPEPGGFVGEFLQAFLWRNLAMAAFNLIPFEPFDGADAWKLPKLLKERWTSRAARASTPSEREPKKLGRGGDVIDLQQRVREITEREARRVREERDRKRLQ